MTDIDPRENPEYYLWVYHGLDTFKILKSLSSTYTTPTFNQFVTAFSASQLKALIDGAEPTNPIEKMLAENPDWVKFWLDQVRGNEALHIRENEKFDTEG